jgi:hypothetical protein
MSPIYEFAPRTFAHKPVGWRSEPARVASWIKLALRQQWRLCHEARPVPSVGLRGMNKEWVAQIDGACRAGCQFNLAIFC